MRKRIQTLWRNQHLEIGQSRVFHSETFEFEANKNRLRSRMRAKKKEETEVSSYEF